MRARGARATRNVRIAPSSCMAPVVRDESQNEIHFAVKNFAIPCSIDSIAHVIVKQQSVMKLHNHCIICKRQESLRMKVYNCRLPKVIITTSFCIYYLCLQFAKQLHQFLSLVLSNGLCSVLSTSVLCLLTPSDVRTT